MEYNKVEVIIMTMVTRNAITYIGYDMIFPRETIEKYDMIYYVIKQLINFRLRSLLI